MTNVQKALDQKTQKSPDAFRTISEVADELNVPQHVLRFWETKFSVVKPLKRGGGRRYYRPADVDLIRGIRDLLYTHGFTIKGAQKLLKEQGGKIENIENLTSINAINVPAQQALTVMPDQHNNGTQNSSPLRYKEQLETVLLELKALRKLLPK